MNMKARKEEKRMECKLENECVLPIIYIHLVRAGMDKVAFLL